MAQRVWVAVSVWSLTGVAEEDGHPAALVGPRFGRHRLQPGPGHGPVEEGGPRTRAVVGSTPR